MLSSDSRPLHVRILSALAHHPDGVSCRALAAELGDADYTVSNVVSKLHQYGGPVEKLGPNRGPAVRWRLRRP